MRPHTLCVATFLTRRRVSKRLKVKFLPFGHTRKKLSASSNDPVSQSMNLSPDLLRLISDVAKKRLMLKVVCTL